MATVECQPMALREAVFWSSGVFKIVYSSVYVSSLFAICIGLNEVCFDETVI